MEELMTTQEIADMLKCTRETVLAYVAQGMPCIGRPRKHKRFKWSACEAWLLENK